MSIDYVMIGTNDLGRARAFYDAVFPALGGGLIADISGFAFCYQFRNGTRAWVNLPQNREPAVPSNGSMPGFRCGSRKEVDAAQQAVQLVAGLLQGFAHLAREGGGQRLDLGLHRRGEAFDAGAPLGQRAGRPGGLRGPRRRSLGGHAGGVIGRQLGDQGAGSGVVDG